MTLNDRKKQILKSIIDAYIASGEPIGSKFLTTFGKIPLSSATIRNEMSELEEMGYLDKPHSSAGRIPSSSAYRLYVDKLMEEYRLNLEELEILNEITQYKMSEIDRIIEEAGKIMSEVTRYVSLAMTSTDSEEYIERFDAVLIDSMSFLLIIITSLNMIKSHHIRVGQIIDEEAINLIKKSLNEHLTHISIDNLSFLEIMKMEQQLGKYGFLASRILRVVYSSFDNDPEHEIKIGGLANLLSYPEFNNIEKLRELMSIFDSKRSFFKNLLASGTNSDEDASIPVPIDAGNGMKIYIGDDTSNYSALSDTSLVFCTFSAGKTDAVVGVLGPKRMDYKKVVSSLKKFAENMSNTSGDKK